MSTYTVTAGDNATDLGIVGKSPTLLGAKRAGRAAVRAALPNGQGTYTVCDPQGREVLRGERSIRTDYQWIER